MKQYQVVTDIGPFTLASGKSLKELAEMASKDEFFDADNAVIRSSRILAIIETAQPQATILDMVSIDGATKQ
jgi:hypothetical protein